MLARKIAIPGYGEIVLEDPILPGGNFTWYEALHGGDRLPQQGRHAHNIVKLARALQPHRTAIGKPFIVTSWYRPDPWNAQTPGAAPNSLHKVGLGIDCYCAAYWGDELYDYFHPRWSGGLGYYSEGRIHLDLGEYARW